MEEEKSYYYRHLPHYQPEYATFHVVFRLAGLLPVRVIGELKQEQEQLKQQTNDVKNKYTQQKQSVQLRKKYFEQFDTLLDHALGEPQWLKVPEVAMIVKEAIHYRDNEAYNLLAFCIMPNHVHMLFELLSNTVDRLVRLQSRPRFAETERAELTAHNIGRDSVSTYMIQ